MLKTYHHPVMLSRNVGTLTSWKPLGHSRPVTGLLYLHIYSAINSCVQHVLRHAEDYDFDIGRRYTRGSQPVQSLTHNLKLVG